MAETLHTDALTSVARVKAILAITDTGWDAVFLRLINSASDFIEGECGVPSFKEQTYTNQVYSNHGMSEFLLLKAAPVSTLTTLEYAVGLPNDKQFTAFAATDYELAEDGKSGIVRVYGFLPRGTNCLRATYTAGYKIDIANIGTATHNLPEDLVYLCDRLVIQMFKRREEHGREASSIESSSVTWSDLIKAEDKTILERYTRPVLFV